VSAAQSAGPYIRKEAGALRYELDDEGGVRTNPDGTITVD
jgi:hypothetical protein